MSLRTRLLLAVGAATLLALFVADLATYSSLRSFLYERVDQSLAQTRTASSPARGGPGGRIGGGSDDPVAGRGAFIATRSDNGGLIVVQPARTASGSVVSLELDGLGAVGDEPVFRTVGSSPGDTSYRVRVTRLPRGDTLLVALPLDDAEATLDRLVTAQIIVTVAALAGASAVGWALVRLGLRPLVQVEETAAAIAVGQLDRRVPGDTAATEVGRLARALNTMLERIEAAFAERDRTQTELRRSEERMRRFVADASHELRTPLSAVSAYAELYERGGKDHPEDLDRLLRGIRAESGRMAVLIDDLLLLARLDEGRPLRSDAVDLGEIAADAVAAAAAVGPAWPVRLVADGPVGVIGDAGRLRQVIDNLLANTRTHTPAGTPVTVTVGDRGDGWALLRVGDEGPGMAVEDRDRVFERFFRADVSRVRSKAASGAGSGLGLSIVAAIVAAHHGHVIVASEPGTGAVFDVLLPTISPDTTSGR